MRKNLEVTKKCVSLQSLSETGERGLTGETSGGARDKIIDKADKNKESTTKVPRTINESVNSKQE